MDLELQNLIENRYAFMSDVYIECDDSWVGLIWIVCSKLERHYLRHNAPLDNIEVLQVKDKYGSLRFYTGALIDGADDVIEGVINKYNKDKLKERLK